MQTSIRSQTPRLVTISANPSSTSIPPLNHGVQIDREVVVTSHTKHPGRRASYSPISPVSSTFGHARAQSQETRRASVNRWDPSGRSMKRLSKLSVGQGQMEHIDPVVWDTNSESMKALAEFLMTREPPPTNWISMHSDDESSLGEMKKFKMFESLKKKKKKNRAPKTPKFFKLPDSAVAASTIQGCRHIAISIPLEHDYPELLKPSSITPNKRPKSAPRLHGSDKGAVTVLKPLVEVRESNSYSPPLANGGNSVESERVRPTSVSTPPIDILGIEATRTLERYYQQLHQQQQRAATERKRPETSRGQTPVGEPSIATSKANSRQSIGTIYSSLVMSTPGHSRDVSGTSTVPVVIPNAGLCLDLPRRGSSKSTIPVSIEHELRIASTKVASFELEKKLQSQKSSSPSLTSDSSQVPTIFGTATAESARTYSSPGPQYFSRSNTPLASAAPTKKLPDLPRGADGQVIRPSTAPLSKSNSANSQKSAKRSASFKDCTVESVETSKQSRQDRVKARKLRDLAAIRGEVDEDDTTPSIPPLNQTPKTSRSSKHRTSGDSVNKRDLNRMSEIMLVANLAPFTGTILSSDLPSPPPTRKRISKQPSSTSTVVRIPTPPRSLHDVDFASDSDTIPFPRPRASRTTVSNSPNRALDARRQERRTKRNMTLHEKELDARLSKIEKDNQLLLSTLKDIATAFGQLGSLLPAEVEDVGMEPLMRELSGGSKGREMVEVR